MSIEEIALWFDVRGIKRDYVLVGLRNNTLITKDKRVTGSSVSITSKGLYKERPFIVPFDLLTKVFAKIDWLEDESSFSYNNGSGAAWIVKYPDDSLNYLQYEKDLLMKRVTNIDNFAEAIKTKILQQDQTNG